MSPFSFRKRDPSEGASQFISEDRDIMMNDDPLENHPNTLISLKIKAHIF
jgi:hypothetical protein